MHYVNLRLASIKSLHKSVDQVRLLIQVITLTDDHLLYWHTWDYINKPTELCNKIYLQTYCLNHVSLPANLTLTTSSSTEWIPTVYAIFQILHN